MLPDALSTDHKVLAFLTVRTVRHIPHVLGTVYVPPRVYSHAGESPALLTYFQRPAVAETPSEAEG